MRRRRRKQPPRARIFLSEPVFITLVASAAEAYRRECYGVLLGARRLGRVYIQAAFAYQTARRNPQSVDLVEGRRRIVRQVLRAFPRYEYVGEFHSHPGYGDERGEPVLSEADWLGVRPGECELVVAVRGGRARMPWTHCADGTLSGAAGRHFLKMRAYLAQAPGSGRLRGRVVGLRCPYAVGTASSRRLLARLQEAPGP